MSYLSHFHGNSVYPNAPQYYVYIYIYTVYTAVTCKSFTTIVLPTVYGVIATRNATDAHAQDFVIDY